MKKVFLQFNKAFTLAEVLITLVIIGVIAALTIPNLVYQTKKTEYSGRLKKFYSTMRQVEQMAEADGNSWKDWAATTAAATESNSRHKVVTFQNKYLLPYMSYVETMDIDVHKRRVLLNDGSYFTNMQGMCMDFNFDVNGDKKPNEIGSDIFVFLYCPLSHPNMLNKAEFVPYTETSNRDVALSRCRNNAINCSTLLMLDGWEFKNDYPYRL